jgi:hypothetical protein
LNGTSNSGRSRIARELLQILDEQLFRMPAEADQGQAEPDQQQAGAQRQHRCSRVPPPHRSGGGLLPEDRGRRPIGLITMNAESEMCLVR